MGSQKIRKSAIRKSGSQEVRKIKESVKSGYWNHINIFRNQADINEYREPAMDGGVRDDKEDVRWV